MLFEPSKGWRNFTQSQELVQFITESLKLDSPKTQWEQFQINDRSSVWCSCETDSTNQIQIEFEKGQNKVKPIKSLGIEMTNNSSAYFKQLFKLKRQLKSRFDIRDT
ncbi:hypothetical protein ACUR5C_03545 [Aliikangiella sp. IMCC44653]